MDTINICFGPGRYVVLCFGDSGADVKSDASLPCHLLVSKATKQKNYGSADYDKSLCTTMGPNNHGLKE